MLKCLGFYNLLLIIYLLIFFNGILVDSKNAIYKCYYQSENKVFFQIKKSRYIVK